MEEPPHGEAPEGVHTVFQGVVLSEVLTGGTGLYEFNTAAGVPVRLHDANFECLEYELRPQPTLLLRFCYDDPRWTPPEAAETPIIVFRFAGVVVEGWEDDPDVIADPVELRGAVSLFDYFPPDGFDLQTSTLRLSFRAAGCAVSLQPRRN